MDKLGLSNAPKYYLLERDPAITNARLESTKGQDDIAIGARIDRIKINGKKENAVILYFSDKKNFTPENYREMEQHRDKAAKHLENFLDRRMKIQKIPREVRAKKIEVIIDKLALGIEKEKHVTVNDAGGTHRTITSKTVQSGHLIDPLLFENLLENLGLPEIDKNAQEVQAEPIDQVIERRLQESRDLEAVRRKQREDREAAGAEFRANYAMRAEAFKRPAAASPATPPSDQPPPIPDGAVADSDSTALTRGDTLPSAPQETITTETKDILLSSVRSARNIARPLLPPEQLLKRAPPV